MMSRRGESNLYGPLRNEPLFSTWDSLISKTGFWILHRLGVECYPAGNSRLTKCSSFVLLAVVPLIFHQRGDRVRRVCESPAGVFMPCQRLPDCGDRPPRLAWPANLSARQAAKVALRAFRNPPV